MNKEKVTRFYADLDSSAALAAQYFAPDASFRFCNLSPIVGRENIASFLQGFFDTISGTVHSVENHDVTEGGSTLVELRVTFVRKDDTTLEGPGAVIFEENEDGIRDYRVYGDYSTL
ncbi:nuclear transport factor 2 family protein [Sphingobium subterraneum]|uniref:Limonene-1,2-epoxide hydrolase n=1 Tax=Sphingobium subterraneum TaxID=627688 RepID=A0A841J0C6_9SPHN|nr:nuclear transport factor 2 family protein [Sphingobium subterraneum]MBB6122976.1 limonene-1,2-epoxide hydrolase [Sphingobium subterraneum]